MEFVTALYASSLTGSPVRRTDLIPGHPFYPALNGGVPQNKISEAFSL